MYYVGDAKNDDAALFGVFNKLMNDMAVKPEDVEFQDTGAE